MQDESTVSMEEKVEIEKQSAVNEVICDVNEVIMEVINRFFPKPKAGEPIDSYEKRSA